MKGSAGKARLAPEATRMPFQVHCRPGILIVATYHAAEVAAHKDVVERGQLQVGGPQVPGQLQALAVRHAAAPVGRTQRTCAGRAFI